MRKAVNVAVTFLASAVAGVLLTLVIGIAIDTVWTFIMMHNHGVLGAVARGISETAVLMGPLLWGVIGTLIVLHRLERNNAIPDLSFHSQTKMEY